MATPLSASLRESTLALFEAVLRHRRSPTVLLSFRDLVPASLPHTVDRGAVGRHVVARRLADLDVGRRRSGALARRAAWPCRYVRCFLSGSRMLGPHVACPMTQRTVRPAWASVQVRCGIVNRSCLAQPDQAAEPALRACANSSAPCILTQWPASLQLGALGALACG